MNRLLYQRTGLILLCFLFSANFGVSLHAQDDTVRSTVKTGSGISLSGSARISGDAYWHQSTGNAKRQYPSRFGRIFLKPTLKIGSVALPFRVALSSSSADAPGQPKPHSSFLNGLTDPANSLGLSPKFGNTTVHLGTHAPELSGLIGSRVHIFGAGVELSSGNVQARLSGGVSQRNQSIPALDTTGKFSETLIRYNRSVIAGRLAWQNKERSFGLNVLYANDDPSSVRGIIPEQHYRVYTNGSIIRTVDWNMRLQQPGNTIVQDGDTLMLLSNDLALVTSTGDTLTLIHETALPFTPTPEQNLVASVDLSFKLKGGISVDAEFAAATFTHNTNGRKLSDTTSSGPNTIEVPLFDVPTQYTTTQFDGAGKITASIEKDRWGLQVEGEYVGPGYVSAGFLYQTTDYIGLDITPHIDFVEAGLRFDGFLGWQRNNVMGQGLTTSNSVFANANVLFQATGDVSLNANYSRFTNYDANNLATSFQSKAVQQSLRLTPLITLPTRSATHSFEPLTELHWSTNSWQIDTCFVAGDCMAHLKPIDTASTIHTATALNTASLTVSGQYRLQLVNPRTPLRVEVGATYRQLWFGEDGSEASQAESSEASGKLSVGYGLLDRRLQPRLYISHAQYGRVGNSSAKRTMVGTGIRWNATHNLQLTLRVESTWYSSGLTDSKMTWDNSFSGTLASLSTNWQW